MKKKLICFTAVVIAAICAFPFAACRPEAPSEAVTLVAVTVPEVGVRRDIDYYVVPEPAASTRVNAIDGLDFSGSLQELYGAQNGYPQAVVVAKNELLGYDVCGRLATALNANREWLLSDATSPEIIVDAVKSHLGADIAPTFTAKNLNKSVLEHCNVNFVRAADCKSEVIDFMTKLNALGTDFGTPADKFFSDGESPAVEYGGELNIYAPDGAPALGIANLLAGGYELENANYNIVDASKIQTFVTGGSPKADICVLPVNLAVKLLGSGEKHTMLGTLTHGNLFLLSQNGERITKENVSSLGGKTVGVINLAAVPGLTFKLILKNNDMEYTELK